MNAETIQRLGERIDEVFLLIAAAIFLIELAEAWFTGSLKRRSIAEMFVSASTQLPYLASEALLLTAGYGLYYIVADALVPWSLPFT